MSGPHYQPPQWAPGPPAWQPPPAPRRMWPWVTLAAVLSAVVSILVTAFVMVMTFPVPEPGPTPEQVVSFTQNAGTELYGRGIWTDDGLLQVGLAVCESNGKMTEGEQVNALKARWGGLDDVDAITLMHHANARLCPR